MKDYDKLYVGKKAPKKLTLVCDICPNFGIKTTINSNPHIRGKEQGLCKWCRKNLHDREYPILKEKLNER